MDCRWFVFVLLISTTLGLQLNHELYHSMPQLFHLDDYEKCLINNGFYCLGTFHLTVPKDDLVVDTSSSIVNNHGDYRGKELYGILQAYSSQRGHYNHTRLHRGLCLRTSYIALQGQVSPRKRFTQYVNEFTRTQYGLDASLLSLDYCKSSQTPPLTPLDATDLSFLALCALLLAANFLGTLYDLFRNKDKKANQLLMSWSLPKNFAELSRSHDKNQITPRFSPLDGVKSLTLILVMLIHSGIVFYMCYVQNPDFLETPRHQYVISILFNGTIAVQMFIVLSSFFLTEKYLREQAKWENLSSVKVFFILMLRRIIRLLPVYLWMVGFTATWSRFIGDGALWTSYMESEALGCRVKWWSHALFINNFYRTDVPCMIQSWFIAVDMQLYAVAIILVLLLRRRTKAVFEVLGSLLVVTVFCNFMVAYIYDLNGIAVHIGPEDIKTLIFRGTASFNWLYITPWGSLPASLMGVMLGFLCHFLRTNKLDLQQYKWFRILHRASVPALFVWIHSAYFLPDNPDRIYSAAFAALDRPIYCLIGCVMMLGLISGIDQMSFLSWRGWEVLSRISLCVLVVHFIFHTMQVALQTINIQASVFGIMGHWFVTMFMTYMMSFPLHLLVEKPTQKFLQTTIGV